MGLSPLSKSLEFCRCHFINYIQETRSAVMTNRKGKTFACLIYGYSSVLDSNYCHNKLQQTFKRT